jgi:hypothetical protein
VQQKVRVEISARRKDRAGTKLEAGDGYARLKLQILLPEAERVRADELHKKLVVLRRHPGTACIDVQIAIASPTSVLFAVRQA